MARGGGRSGAGGHHYQQRHHHYGTMYVAKVVCFRLTFLLILILTIIGGGLLIWSILPDQSKDDILDTILQDPEPPTPTYTFMQCSSTSASTTSSSATSSSSSSSVKEEEVEEGQGAITTTETDKELDVNNEEELLCCNGLSSICDLLVSEILYAGLHNAMATLQDGFIIAPNHDYSLEYALDAGYRAINLDIAICDGRLALVHGYCALGTRDPIEVLRNINLFLDDNPSEVIIITMQIDNDANDDDSRYVTVDDIDEMINTVGNTFRNRLYEHTLGTFWPTLRELVQQDRRIIFSHYNGGNTLNCYEVDCPSGYHEWFSIAKESQFQFDDIDDIRNSTYSCTVTRGRENMNRGLYAINMFLSIPSRTTSDVLNSKDFAQYHINQCSNQYNGEDVNVIFIDFWHLGNIPEVVQIHNEQIAATIKSETTTTTETTQTEEEASSEVTVAGVSNP